MINIYTGRPGTGKTYSLVRLAYLKIRKEQQHIYSNFYINFSELEKRDKICLNKYLHFWDKIEDLIKIKQGIILIDEAQIYFNSRNWTKLPLRLQYKFQQHRKHGLDIFGAVQNVNRIDKIIRELVNNVFVIRKMGRLFLSYQYDIEEIDKAKRKAWAIRPYLFNKTIAESYDTFFEIHSDIN